MLLDRPAAEVVESLVVGSVQITAQGLRLTEDDAGPEQVDVTGVVGRGAPGVLLEQVDALGDDPEGLKQVRPELLSVGLLGVLGTGLTPPVDTLAPVG